MDTDTKTRVTWSTKFLGDFHAFKSAEELEEFCDALRALGFEPVLG